jgi:hypothetical protein
VDGAGFHGGDLPEGAPVGGELGAQIGGDRDVVDQALRADSDRGPPQAVADELLTAEPVAAFAGLHERMFGERLRSDAAWRP